MIPSVALISHVYLEARYRSKLTRLAQHVDLTLISPDRFPTPYGTVRADYTDVDGYRVLVYPCAFPIRLHTSTRWVLLSSDLGFRAAPPQIIHVENEAHSFSLAQALTFRRLYAPRAKVVVFVWANQRLLGRKKLLLEPLARLMQLGIDFYIAGNSDGMKLLCAAGVPENRVTTFPLVGLDLSVYRPPSIEERRRRRIELGTSEDQFVVGFVGRFVRDKGLEDLVQAIRLVKAHSPARVVRLLCVGDGPLKADLVQLGPDAIVVSPGGASRVIPYYHAMDVLVLPSRTMPHWKEQFGLVLAEAMSCGVPVVGSDSGAIPEVVGGAGLVFKERDAGDLADRLTTVMTSDALRQTLRQRGLRRVHERYSDQRIAEHMVGVYHRVLGADAHDHVSSAF